MKLETTLSATLMPAMNNSKILSWLLRWWQELTIPYKLSILWGR